MDDEFSIKALDDLPDDIMLLVSQDKELQNYATVLAAQLLFGDLTEKEFRERVTDYAKWLVFSGKLAAVKNVSKDGCNKDGCR